MFYQLKKICRGMQRAFVALIVVGLQHANAADTCLANPDWGIIISDHGYADVLMDLRIVDGVNYRGREYLSGEWGHAITYVRDGVPMAPIWLEPDFIFPDWTTNSDFAIVSPMTLLGPNADGFEVWRSVIANADIEIEIISQMVDNGAVGVQMGMTASSAASVLVSPITSNEYVLVQDMTYTNVSGVAITDVAVVQMMHGLVSLVSLHDTRSYPPAGTDPYGFDTSHVFDTTVIGQDGENGSFADPAACIPGAVIGSAPPGIAHFDVLTFHTAAPPVSIDSDFYGDRDVGDSHVIGKPSVGTHINIETGAMNSMDFFDPGDPDYPPEISLTPTYGDTHPSDFWVAGAQAHFIGDLLPGQPLMFDYVLSLQTSEIEIPEPEPDPVLVPIPVFATWILGVLMMAIVFMMQARVQRRR